MNQATADDKHGVSSHGSSDPRGSDIGSHFAGRSSAPEHDTAELERNTAAAPWVPGRHSDNGFGCPPERVPHERVPHDPLASLLPASRVPHRTVPRTPMTDRTSDSLRRPLQSDRRELFPKPG